jgi:outer membrane lipoprotein SlyB
MKPSSSVFAALAMAGIATVSGLSGCASNNPSPAPVTYSSANQQSEMATYGTIDSIQIVQSGGGTSGVGAVTGGLVGALLGNQIGSGGGRTAATVAGAAGGALVGNKVEANRNSPHDTYQISIRMDNGDYRIVNQDNIGDLRAGNRVRLINGQVYRY